MSEIESVRQEGYCFLNIEPMAARSLHFNGTSGPLLTLTAKGELQFGEGVGPKEAAAAIAEAFKEFFNDRVKAAAAEQSTRDAAIFDELRALCAPGAEALPDGVRLTRIIQVLDPLLAPGPTAPATARLTEEAEAFLRRRAARRHARTQQAEPYTVTLFHGDNFRRTVTGFEGARAALEHHRSAFEVYQVEILTQIVNLIEAGVKALVASNEQPEVHP